MDALTKINADAAFATLLGIEFTSAAPDRVTAEMTVATISAPARRSCMAAR